MASILFGVTVPVTADRFLRSTLDLLVKEGWDVHLACAPDDGFAQLATMRGVTLHALAMQREPSPLSDLRSLANWWRLVGRVRPDVMVVSTPKAGLLGMLAARARRVPVRVYHLRGFRAEGLRGILRRVSVLSERVAVRCATDVLCDSPSLASSLEEAGVLGSHQSVVLGRGSCSGVDTEHFVPPSVQARASSRASLGFSDSEVVVGFVGRVTADKGIRELMSAAAAVHATFPQVRLLVAGPIEDPDVMPSRIAGAVEWLTETGPVTDPRRVYAGMDLFILPSYREGFPVSPLEAQASGLPVITTDVTGCRDCVEPGLTGLLVPARDSEALAKAIARLVDDERQRHAMGAAGRMWVLDHFAQHEVDRRTVDFLAHLSASSSPSAAN